MEKTVDIDALLASDRLVMTLGGVVYEIEDVNLSVFMMTPSKSDQESDILHEQLSSILKVDKKELKNIGLRAAAFALKEIRNWVTETSMEEEEGDDTSPKNP